MRLQKCHWLDATPQLHSQPCYLLFSSRQRSTSQLFVIPKVRVMLHSSGAELARDSSIPFARFLLCVPQITGTQCIGKETQVQPSIRPRSPIAIDPRAWIVAADSVGASSYRPHYLFERRTKNQESSRCTSEDAHCAPFLCLEPDLLRSHRLRGAPLCIIHRIHRSSARCHPRNPQPHRQFIGFVPTYSLFTVLEARTRGAGQLADTRSRARLHGTAANPKLAVPLPPSARILQTTYGLIRTRHRTRSRRRPSYRS
ncbi:hypothetical protein OH76DRAFT_126365 [Lentinus brumalis]|uniref:Uncharacterized protein n=1 Tax=Lentinus brumalis TaxID=2498619 RepID=A0A371DJU3_9APHY|nr:hypothetical protein OH76DRAFT_126365 [Polyporus brumalis]